MSTPFEPGAGVPGVPGDREPGQRAQRGRANEPIHQPPNPADLEQSPPQTPECARIRGMLRDFVDHDLDEALTREVEDHVHGCRTCGLSLARVECESYRLRSGFLGSWAVVGPRPGFSKRVVGRLLAETETDRGVPVETAGIGEEVPDDPELATALRIAAAGAARARAAVTARGAARPMRSARERRSMMFAAVAGALLIAVAVGMVWGGSASLSAVVRISLVAGHNVWLDVGADRHRLTGGDGIGEGAVLVVDPDGSAEVHLHDASLTGEQPAADIKIGGDSELGLQDGYPLLARGSIEVHSKRDMMLLLADGSRIALGEGEYHISATEQSSVFDALAAAAPPLSVRVEVLDGDGAHVAREGGGGVLVAVGQVGQYGNGLGGISVANLPPRGGALAARAPAPQREQRDDSEPELVGFVVDGSNAPLPGCRVTLNYQSGHTQIEGMQVVTNEDGRYSVQTVGALRDNMVVVSVQPPEATSLGFRVPDAMRVAGEPGAYRVPNIALGAGLQVHGVTSDPTGVPIGNVRVVACLYDEVLGLVKPWVRRAQQTDEAGNFTIPGLPATLPQNQVLCVIAFHGSYDVSFQAMPFADSAYAALGPARVVMQPLPRVTIRGLSQWLNQEAWVFEELPGLPSRGMGMRHHGTGVVQGDTIEGLQVGPGQLWLRVGQGSMLRPLMAGAGGVLVVGATEQPFETVFATAVNGMDELAGVPNQQRLLLTARQRHDGYRVSQSQNLFFVSNQGAAVGTTIEGAQVFALAPQAFGGFAPRFLGAQGPSGMPMDFDQGECEVVAIAGNKVCWRNISMFGPANNRTLYMQDTGSVEFAPALVPQQGMQLTIRSQVVGTAGLRPPFYRFITQGDAVVGSLPWGRYSILDSLGRTRDVTVYPGQVVRVWQ